MKVVFDNNVLISAALLKNSVPFKAFRKAVEIHTILRSQKILAELQSTIFRSKFDRYFQDNSAREGFVLSFIASSINTEVTHKVTVCRDIKDNMYLELALSGKATCIVSGDSDLLALHPFCSIPVVTPKEFLDNF
jgi:putative PIN family toxin of toxin-antitoxin system